jgi:hypothetical protein
VVQHMTRFGFFNERILKEWSSRESFSPTNRSHADVPISIISFDFDNNIVHPSPSTYIGYTMVGLVPRRGPVFGCLLAALLLCSNVVAFSVLQRINRASSCPNHPFVGRPTSSSSALFMGRAAAVRASTKAKTDAKKTKINATFGKKVRQTKDIRDVPLMFVTVPRGDAHVRLNVASSDNNGRKRRG